MDLRILRLVEGFRTPWLTHGMELSTHLGGRAELILGLLAIALFGWIATGSVRWFALAALCFAGAFCSVAILKPLIDRPRPTVGVLIPPDNSSFPSGHAVYSTALFGAFIYASGCLRARRARLLAAVAAGACVAIVGFSRVYLGEHWPSDVVAGIAIGIAVVAGAVRWSAAPRGSGGKERKPHLPVGVVGVQVDQHDALPGPERDLAADHGHGQRRADENR